MILDGVCYLVILFCRVILSHMVSPLYSAYDEYLGPSTSTFVSGRLFDVFCVSPDAALLIIRYL